MEHRLTMATQSTPRMFPTEAVNKMETLILCDFEVTLTVKLAFSLHPTSSKNGNIQIVSEYVMYIMTST